MCCLRFLIVGETEKARPSSENVSPLLDNFSPPSANVNPPPKTVTPPKNGIPPSENASIPTGNVYLQPENCDPLAENTSPPIGNGSSPTGNKSLPNNHLDELEVNNKPDGAQIDPQAAEEESSKASGGSISNIHHGSIVPSNLNEKGNVSYSFFTKIIKINMQMWLILHTHHFSITSEISWLMQNGSSSDIKLSSFVQIIMIIKCNFTFYIQ